MLQIESTRVMDQVLVRITCIHHGEPAKSHELVQRFWDAEALPGSTRGRKLHAACSLTLQDLGFHAWTDSNDCQGD